MEILKSVLGAGADSNAQKPSSAETIERLVDRLSSSTLLDDRRDACRALKAMSRKFRVEVGVQALDVMTVILETDRNDDEIVGYALDTLCNICSPEEFEEEVATEAKESIAGIGEQFTEIYLKSNKHVQCVVDLLEEYEFKIRRPAVRLLTHLLTNKPREMQEMILSSQMGVSRLMDVLVDSREILRNDVLLLLIQLTKGNANLQKIVAFENAFDKLVDIIQTEGYSDGGIVVEDCLRLMLNLLRNNSSNQTFFREGSYIQRITPFFDLTLDQEEIEVGWSAQKVSNMLHMLMVVRTLVSPLNSKQVASSCQNTIKSCTLLEKLANVLMASGIPADILTETINTLSEAIRGNISSQQYFAHVEAPSVPRRPVLILLLMSMVNEKQPFALRCAVLYCFQCFLHNNPAGQNEVVQTLLPSNQIPKPDDISAGQLLCGGLFSADVLSNWFSSVALAHCIIDQESLKVELLRVQLSTSAGNEPVSLMQQCASILQHTLHVQTRLGLLMLISTWSAHCPQAVAQLMAMADTVPFLTGQVGSNEHDDIERLSQGLCAYLLGLCVLNNDNSVPNNSQEKLLQLIEKRIGHEAFLDKMSEVSKHEAYNKALKHPQLKSTDSKDLVFDNKFCQHFKHLEHEVINFLSSNQGVNKGDQIVETGVVLQYKELIREQDVKINEISHANIYLQEELGNAKAQVEELKGTIQTLKDENSIIRAQNGGFNHVIPSATAPPDVNVAELVDKCAKLERELKIRDEIIQELEVRLASSIETPATSDIEVNNLRTQLEALQLALGQKDAEIEQIKTTSINNNSDPNEELKQLQSEQEDLLLMLSDQDGKLREYKKRLRDLGQPVEDDDDEISLHSEEDLM